MSDATSKQAVKELAHKQIREKFCGMALKEQRDFYIKLADSIIDLLPSVEPEQKTCPFTVEEIKTIRIHMNAIKGDLCNQHRWKDAEEYQQIVDKLDSIMEVDE